MSPIILLCVLLQAFCTCSLVDVKVVDSAEPPQSLLNKHVSLENLTTILVEAFENVDCPTLFLDKLVALDKAVERGWSMCLDKMSAYSHNQDFFANTLPAFVGVLDRYLETDPPLNYTVDTMVMRTKIFCQKQSCKAYLKDLKQLAKLFEAGRSPFEGLGDKLFASIANHLRITANIRKLYSMVEDPQIFANVQPYTMDRSARFDNELFGFLSNLKILVKKLENVDLMSTYRPFLSSLQVAKRTMAASNEALLDSLVAFDLRHISLLAQKVSEAISLPSETCGFSTSAKNILSSIEAITVPLYRSSFEMGRDLVEQQGRGEVLWSKFVESLLAFGSILTSPDTNCVKQVSEAFSELISHLLDTFIRGEDELWTLGLHIKLEITETLWLRALEISNFSSGVTELVICSKYISFFWADLPLLFQIMAVVEELEDPLALDRPTREKLVEFWSEARALWRLLRSLSMLEFLAGYFDRMEKVTSLAEMNESLSAVLDEQINVVQRQGINFYQGEYHQFVNELPEHQGAIALHLKKFSDDLVRAVASDATFSMVNKILLSLKSSTYEPLKQSLGQLFTDPSKIYQLESLRSHTSRRKNKTSKNQRKKLKQAPKSLNVVAPKVPASSRQVFVPSGPQHGGVKDVPRSADDDLNLFTENFEKSWNLIKSSRKRHNVGSLVKQPAWQVLKRFAARPKGLDGAPPADPRDMRSDRRKVKIAAFNAEWLFLFNLATEKLQGKVKWKSLKEAWDHIRDVADAIRKIHADIICLCEVQDLRILSILVELLPELNYRAYLIPSHDSLSQNVGILTRVDTHASISKIEQTFFTKNIVFHIKLDNGYGDLVDVVVTGVHLISTIAEADPAERARRRENQARALKKHLADDDSISGEVIHLVLGDFNMVDSKLLSAKSSHPSEEALRTVKNEMFDLFNAMDLVDAQSDLLSSSVCHIFTSRADLVADAYIFNLDDNSTTSRLERVSDHPPVVAIINLPPHYSQLEDKTR